MTAATNRKDIFALARAVPARVKVSAKANAIWKKGWHLATDSTGFAVKFTEALGLKSAGLALEDVDNTGGADGAITSECVSSPFVQENGTAGDVLAIADLGSVVYMADNQTACKTSNDGARSPGGVLIDLDADTGKPVIFGGPIGAALAASIDDLGSAWVVGTALLDAAATTIQRAGRRTSFLLASTMSQDETITFGTTGAVKGDVIRVIRTSVSAHTAAMVNGGAGAGTMFTMPNSKVNFTEAMFDGTNWLVQSMGVN